jgi:hypothetical protein
MYGATATIPNPGVLARTLGMQEASDNSAIENIVISHGERC